MRALAAVLLLALATAAAGQHLKTIHASGYTHNYVTGPLSYLEDPADTTQLHYIATVELTDDNFLAGFFVINWVDLLEPKAREAGADVFIVEKSGLGDKSATITFRLYFGGKKFALQNEEKRLKGICVFYDPHNNGKVRKGSLQVKPMETARFLFERGEEGSVSLNVDPAFSNRRTYFGPGVGYFPVTAYAGNYAGVQQQGYRRRGMFVYNPVTIAELGYLEGRMLFDIYLPRK